jgi:very-short-patch-repair endonuclease
MTQVDGWRDGRIAALAGRQRTIVSHQQLIALGCSRRVIAHWVNRGRLQLVFFAVYSVVCGELPPLAREQAALLACGERSFLSHHTAAAIWGLRRPLPVEVQVSVVGRRCSSRKGMRRHEIHEIDREELRHHEGLWVSSPERAILEIAGALPAPDVAAAIDDGLAGKVLNRRKLADVLARHRGRRGAGRLAAVLAGGTGRTITRSRAERAFLKLIRDARLPAPQVNEPFGRWELDFVWPEHRLVVEIDGYGFHSGPRAFHRDHEKDLALADARLDVRRFTRHHVVEQSALVLARVAAELARRARPDQ